jgi:hypothetical protein
VIPLDLRRAERRAYLRGLVSTHSIRVRVDVLSLEHDRLASLTNVTLDGQVNVDLTAEVTRAATVTFLDTRRGISFDSDSPADGALFADRMLRITYGVKSDAMGAWVDVPIFTGPIIKLDRDGDLVTVEAQGKELLALSPAWKPLTLKKGTDKVDAIRTIMRWRAGETRFALPDLKGNLPKDLSLGRREIPWEAVKSTARSLNRQVYYDGAGVLRLRAYPENSLYTFRSGTGGNITSDPQVAYDIGDLRNVVLVRGGKPRGVKADNNPLTPAPKKVANISYVAVPDKRHPLSPERLGRNDVPRRLVEFVDDDTIRSKKEAERVAERMLRSRLWQAVDVSFEALPVPHLDVGDTVRVVTDDFAMSFRLRQFSIPLSSSGTMSVGFLRRVSRMGRRNRR